MSRTPSKVIMKEWSGCPMGALSLGDQTGRGKHESNLDFFL